MHSLGRSLRTNLWLKEGRGFEPRRSPAYTNRYTNLDVIGRNWAICCGHFSR